MKIMFSLATIIKLQFRIFRIIRGKIKGQKALPGKASLPGSGAPKSSSYPKTTGSKTLFMYY